MLSIEYKNLITQLKKLTESNKITWAKFDSKNSLFCNTDGKKIILDKYYSKIENKDINCINLTILKNNNDILDEIVYCDNDTIVITDFGMLNELYSAAEKKYLDVTINNELRKISESLQHH